VQSPPRKSANRYRTLSASDREHLAALAYRSRRSSWRVPGIRQKGRDRRFPRVISVSARPIAGRKPTSRSQSSETSPRPPFAICGRLHGSAVLRRNPGSGSSLLLVEIEYCIFHSSNKVSESNNRRRRDKFISGTRRSQSRSKERTEFIEFGVQLDSAFDHPDLRDRDFAHRVIQCLAIRRSTEIGQIGIEIALEGGDPAGFGRGRID
jgi:hypothetical protein